MNTPSSKLGAHLEPGASRLLGVPPSSFSSPQPEVFSSQKGDAGIEAHLKARPGTLFPLPSGLCFLESVRKGGGGGGMVVERRVCVAGCRSGGDATTCVLLLSPHSRVSDSLFPRPYRSRSIQPALFIPLADIASMELARAGGTSSTFDVYVHTRDGGVREFAALPREEAGPLESESIRCLWRWEEVHSWVGGRRWHGASMPCSRQTERCIRIPAAH